MIRQPYYGWETVQVKSTYTERPSRRGRKPYESLSLRRCNENGSRPYHDGDFDWLYAGQLYGSEWMIPWSAIRSIKSSISIGSHKWNQYMLEKLS